jgi:dTDP-4-amino-4,6-dideoxygalactose transaminase
VSERSFIPAAKPLVGAEERAAVDRVMRSGMLAQGPEVAAFEDEFAKLVDGRHCVAVNSGTSALHLALVAMGLEAGDEVLVPSFTYAASANAIRLAGGIPVFIDIDPRTFCLDVAAAEAAVTDRTRAVMPVHLYGHPADMTGLSAVADKHDLLVVEDAAQAVASSLNGRPVGAFGTTACFSFYPTKNMTSGEGGMVTTPDAGVARLLRLLRNQGMERRYENEVIGFNNRMTDLHAAIGRVQLGKLDAWTARRQENARFLDQNLSGVEVPYVAPGAGHVYHQYTVRITGHDRDAFAAALHELGVGSGVYYPVPVHRLPSFDLDLDLPETERAAREVLSLPVHPALTEEELTAVVQAVNSVAAAGS